MSEKAKEPKQVVYILVPELNRPIFKGRVFVKQIHAIVENGQQVAGESTDALSPDGFGVYAWSDDHPEHEARVRAMESFKKKKNTGRKTPFIIGPFDCRKKAIEEMDAVREKPAEEVNAQLKQEVAAKDDEIARLKEKIAAAQKKPGGDK